MSDSSLSNAGQASALASLEADVEKILGHWERSDRLASEAAEQLLTFVLRDKRLQKALCEIEAAGGNGHSLAAVIENFSGRDA